MRRSRETNFLIGIALLAAVVIILYWALWFLAPTVVQNFAPGSPEYPAYITFEQAFPLADAWLALAALCGAIGLLRRREWGLLFMLVGGGSAIFLGLMDLLYDLEHGVLVPLTSAAATELIIVVLELGLGTSAILLGWRAWRRLVQRTAQQLP